MKIYKSILPLTLAALVTLTSCGDTSKVDSLISQADSEKSSDSSSAESADILDSLDPSAIAESYWEDKQATPVPDQVDLADIDTSSGDIDVDLTKLESNLVYAQVFDMVQSNTDKYIGKKIKARGTFAYTTDPATGGEYFAVFIADASACCQQGLEFQREGDFKYPDDYPKEGDDITVVGTFDTYTEGSYTYCTLKDAQMETA